MNLDLHLDTLRRLIDPASGALPEERNAAKTLLQQLDEARKALEEIDLSGLHRELDDLLWDSDFDELPDRMRRRAQELETEISGFKRLLRQARENKYAVAALAHLVHGFSRQEVLSDLAESRWAEKHQVLTRWAWNAEQKRQVATGTKFNRLFLGEVGPRQDRQGIDREFYALLRFPMLYQAASGRKLLFSSYRGDTHESPDFDLTDERGSLVGLEVTEVTLDKRAYPDEIARQHVMEEIESELSANDVVLTIVQRPGWKALKGKVDLLRIWLRQILTGGLPPGQVGRRKRFSESSFGPKSGPPLVVEIKRREQATGSVILDGSGSDGRGRGYVGSEVETTVACRAIETIRKKVSAPRPVTRPCILVLYENTGLPVVDFGVVRRKVRQEFGSSFKSHFREIWIMDDRKGMRLVGRG